MNNRLLCAALAAALLLGACSRQSGPGPASPDTDTPPAKPGVSVSEPSGPESSSSGTYAPEIPSPELTLYDWWKDYIYDATYILQGDYPSPIPLDDSLSIIEYCGARMYRDGTIAEAGKNANGSGDSILPKATLAEYTKRYFNIDLANLDTIVFENEDGSAVLRYLNVGDVKAGENPADETLSRNDTFTLKEATNNPDGTVTLRVDIRDYDQYVLFTMAPNGQGGYYFKEIHTTYGTGESKVQLSGSYQTLDTLLGMDARTGSGRLYGNGNVGGKAFFAHFHNQLGYISMSLLDPEKLSEKIMTILLKKGEKVLTADADGYHIIIVTNRRVITMGPDFSDRQENPPPKQLTDKFGDDLPVMKFSPDLKKAAYCDEEGMRLLDLTSGKDQLLEKHPNYNPDAEGKEMMSWQTFGPPRFVNNGQQVAATIVGYEWTLGQYVYNLATGEGRTLDASYGWGGPNLVVGDKAFAFQAMDENSNPTKNIWMDTVTGEVHNLTLPAGIGQINTVSTDGQTIYIQTSDTMNHYTYYRMNMDSLTLEPLDFSLKGTDAQMIAVIPNGKILLNYYDLDSGKGAYILAG